MSEFTIEQNPDKTDRGVLHDHVLYVVNCDGYTDFKGSKDVLRKVLFLIADFVWPNWWFDEVGREAYENYVYAAIENGNITKCADRHFLEKAWPRVRKHLELDGIEIRVVQDLSSDATTKPEAASS